MVKVHRSLLARYDHPVAINLDTSYGFQENVPQMTAKLVDFFETSLQTTLEPVHLSSYEAASPVERAIVKQRVREANYVFAGPGSPSYALAQWGPLGIVEDFAAALERGATLCFASAATLTLGSHTAPIYEVYKAGIAPYWLTGLDLLGHYGLACSVVPHYDNAEGRDYDTSRCYLGERRLALLEAELPEDVAILGVDEHTALVLDLAADEARVVGRANAYWRLGDEVRTLERGSTTSLDELRTRARRAPRTALTPSPTAPTDSITVLADRALRGDVDALATLVSRAQGAAVPTTLVEATVDAREYARRNAQYELADRLRDALLDCGVDVFDGPEATTWSQRSV